ncbi:Lipase class 3-related protein [Dorcoceras hygrometricum]|uniref:Lipase class 3-related protein n=1 Tax=Dorcoceras hygrometricum TaxID=472368 RepID=A0A2Z7C8G6_9LAMI|nr:Lipase class 3-related protein [Dorcoceras hygrometricum]
METPQSEIFHLSGPTFLTSVDWSNSYHRRSIAACLVQGVYVLEHDRQKQRQGPAGNAAPWWEFFDFKLTQVLVDEHDLSIFGAILEFKFPYHLQHNHPTQRPPQYAIAFRGTMTSPQNRSEDLKLDLHCVLNDLRKSTRIQNAIETVLEIVSRAGLGNVWLAGHSLGSSMALIIGRELAKNTGTHLETYLFNPPFISLPVEWIPSEKLKEGLRFANSVITAGLAMMVNGHHSQDSVQHHPFILLSSWVPYLFLNPFDPICCEYIGYFEHRVKMEAIGAGKIGKLATQHSIGSIVSGGRETDFEAIHLIPSAYLTVHSGTNAQGIREAHGIEQWWKQELEFKYNLYHYM